MPTFFGSAIAPVAMGLSLHRMVATLPSRKIL